MLDFNVTYCLKTNQIIPLTIKGIIDETILTKSLKLKGVNIGDYICQKTVKGKQITTYHSESDLMEFYIKPPESYIIIK